MRKKLAGGCDPLAGQLDEDRIQLNPEPVAPEALGDDRRRAGAKEGIEHEVARIARAGDQLGDEFDRLLAGVTAFLLR